MEGGLWTGFGTGLAFGTCFLSNSLCELVSLSLSLSIVLLAMPVLLSFRLLAAILAGDRLIDNEESLGCVLFARR